MIALDDSIHKSDFLLRVAHIPGRYYDIFYKMQYIAQSSGKKPVFVDCGAHRGVVSDLAVLCGGISYAFEPNIYLHAWLEDKYKHNENVHLYPFAVSDINGVIKFRDCGVMSDAGTIAKDLTWGNDGSYEVKMIDLVEFLEQEILSKNERIYFLKLDVEGAEFDIMPRILQSGIFKKIDFIGCETHERGFKDGTQKIKKLKQMIEKYKATNIMLDWI